MMRLLFCVIALAAKVTSEGCHFGYVGDNGVDRWGEKFGDCLGKHQSPIDIDSTHVTTVSLSPLQMNGFDIPFESSLTNNGHTAMLSPNSPECIPTITGGPLNGEYEFAQLHFHWGSNDSCGSEDQFNDKVYPIELHLVFYKKVYGDSNLALSYCDGLTVLACIFEIQYDDNENYNGIVKTLRQIETADSVEKISNPPALFDLLPSDLSSYFTYNGSLTTPPCSESVIWIEFDNAVKISDEQLQAFRRLTDGNGNIMINNFRAIQPLGDRVVLYNKSEIECNSLLRKTKRIISKVADKFFEMYLLLTSLF